MLSPALLPGYVEPGKSGLHPTAAARSVWLLPRPLNPCVFTRVSCYLISWYSKPRNWLGSPLCSRTREEEKGVTRRRATAVGDVPQESRTLTCPAPCGARHAEMQLQTLNPLWAPDRLPRAALWRTRRAGQTGQRITFVATEREEVACHLAGWHIPASIAGCLHLTSGAAPQPAAPSRQGGSLPGTLLVHHRGEERQTHILQLLQCPLGPVLAEGKSMLGDVHLQRQQLLPTSWSPCLAPVSSQRGVLESRMGFTW